MSGCNSGKCFYQGLEDQMGAPAEVISAILARNGPSGLVKVMNNVLQQNQKTEAAKGYLIACLGPEYPVEATVIIDIANPGNFFHPFEDKRNRYIEHRRGCDGKYIIGNCYLEDIPDDKMRNELAMVMAIESAQWMGRPLYMVNAAEGCCSRK